ncbi:MAG: aminotransferase class IV [Bacteroidota bacterium]|nr:aminotransferase class IV [Bacteroidota bacterium]
MKGILNNLQFIDGENIISSNDRAARYGDGLFETIIFSNGKLKFWENHFNRLIRGMKILKIEFDSEKFENSLMHSIYKLISDKNLSHRLRIRVWRKGDGLYLPIQNDYNLLVEAKEITVDNSIKKLDYVGISNQKLVFSPISHLKTLNALPYVMAKIEAKDYKWDDAILTDTNGNYAECSASNLFFISHDKVVTPALESGCIEGVMRKVVIDSLTIKGMIPTFVLEGEKYFKTFIGCFCTNVSGIQVISNINRHSYNTIFALEFIRENLKDVWN